ncbi:methyl-accepting chemotaxis protein [Accumulibacter sp.]|uniref:methyl-accepting chemotaxis protein n=1 Tax=Accumulibacter sp. TaxID=2053492 RepID=UPI0028C4F339|nr:methyl-accepting chemotaxis protein [Accumulibacter sp.]
MRILFVPAIALLNRLGYTTKFAIMGVLALVAISVLAVNLYHSLKQVIHRSQQELVGIEVIRPMASLIQHLQIHRGFSSGVLNGDERMEYRRAASEKGVKEAFSALNASLPPELAAREAWKKIVDSWALIEKDGLKLSVDENFASHTRLIGSLVGVQGGAADQYALTNDPDIDSRYLIDTVLDALPAALDSMGQLRALGTGALSLKEPLVLSQQIRLSVLLGSLNSSVASLQRNLEKTSRYNPDLQAALDMASKDMGAAAEKFDNLVTQDILTGRYETLPAVYFAVTTRAIEKGYKEMFESLLPSLEALLQQRVERAQRDLNINLAVSVLILLIYVYVSIGLYYATIGSINRLAANARTIATGDLSVAVDLGTRDELKLVGDSLNAMTAAFRTLIQNVQRSAGAVLDATKELASSAVHITRSSEQQSDAASTMAAAIEEMTAGIENLSVSAEDADRLSGRAGELAAGGSQVVGNVVQEIERIAEVVNQSASIITELGGRSEQISAIVKVIKEIADQTNLLALNAAIEAARAGEAGRGFAVVADEVRKLAERTTRSTQEISGMIGAIQSGSREAVASMNLGVSRVTAGVALATQAGESLGEIGGNARQVVDSVAHISHALREQSVASNEIAQNVENVARMAGENCAAVAGNAGTAVQLERLSEALDAEVRRFKLA